MHCVRHSTHWPHLALLSFPKTLETAFEKINTLKDKFSGMMGSMSALMGGKRGVFGVLI